MGWPLLALKGLTAIQSIKGMSGSGGRSGLSNLSSMYGGYRGARRLFDRTQEQKPAIGGGGLGRDAPTENPFDKYPIEWI